MTATSLLLGLLIATQTEPLQQAASTPLDPSRLKATWSGVVRNDQLLQAAPKSGLILDGKSFAELWKLWRPGTPLPEVDFGNSFIVVGTIDGPNRMFMGGTLDREGNLSANFGGTKMGGPGFGYFLAQLPKDGITTVNGQSVSNPSNEEERGTDTPPGRNQRERREIVRVAIEGRLEAGVVAIGGETTGTLIHADGMTFELAFKDALLQTQTDRLNGQPVLVTGRLTTKQGIETGQRWIIETDWISPSDALQP